MFENQTEIKVDQLTTLGKKMNVVLRRGITTYSAAVFDSQGLYFPFLV